MLPVGDGWQRVLGLSAGLGLAGRAARMSRPVRDPGVPVRLQAALEARVAAGAPGVVARIEAPRTGLTWDGAAGYLARGDSRALRPDDAFRAASVTKSVTATVAVRLAARDAWHSTSHWLTSLPLNCLTAGPPWMLFRAPHRANCSRTPQACLTTSPTTRHSPHGCAQTRAAPGARPSWWTMRLPTECRAFLPARALNTATPATWSPGSW
jgi:beta-lactamase family protein